VKLSGRNKAEGSDLGTAPVKIIFRLDMAGKLI
jgi:hypothetical protein